MATVFRGVILAPKRRKRGLPPDIGVGDRLLLPALTANPIGDQWTLLPPKRGKSVMGHVNTVIPASEPASSGPTNRHHLSLSLGAGFS